MRLTVIGTGYLGAVHAACMVSIGHEVLGMDADEDKISQLAEGRSPFFEPGLEELLYSGVRSERLRFTDSMADATRFGDVLASAEEDRSDTTRASVTSRSRPDLGSAADAWPRTCVRCRPGLRNSAQRTPPHS